MYDNGFSRAQAAYDAQEPPDNTQEWESYEAKYNTPENDARLLDILADELLPTLEPKAAEATINFMNPDADDFLQIKLPKQPSAAKIARHKIMHKILQLGIKALDIDGKDKLYADYDIAPSFDSFCDTLYDDSDPLDREPDEDELQDRMGR